jgi:hypothetical protein
MRRLALVSLLLALLPAVGASGGAHEPSGGGREL